MHANELVSSRPYHLIVETALGSSAPVTADLPKVRRGNLDRHEGESNRTKIATGTDPESPAAGR
jgi:hypothetical protein